MILLKGLLILGDVRVSDLVIDVRRRSLSACSSWYRVVLELHRFFIAIVRANT